MADDSDLPNRVEAAGRSIQDLLDGAARVIVGQRPMLERMVMGLLCQGHVLFEGMPGLGKSLMVRTLAKGLRADFQRIQFTPDLLPADLTGTQIFDPKKGEFYVREGPIFSQIILADEINRAPPKVQSALLEAMQERQVTLGGETRSLPDPFIVLATQNPIEHEGTYPLPEAQIDRFLMKVLVPYPGADQEIEIVKRMAQTGLDLSVEPVMEVEELKEARALLNRILVDEKIVDYAVRLVLATRAPDLAGLGKLKPLIQYGASPRASIALILAARAKALIEGRNYVIPRDVKEVAPDVLRHRIILSFEAEAEEVDGAGIIAQILDSVEVP